MVKDNLSFRYVLALFAFMLPQISLADGPLDSDFAQGYGIATFPIGTASAVVYALTKDTQGRLLSAGYDTGGNVMIFTRHEVNGTADINLFAENFFGDYPSNATSIAVDSKGRVLVGGEFGGLPIACGSSSTSSYFYAARVFSEIGPRDGDRDNSFGSTAFPGIALTRTTDCETSRENGITTDTNDSVIAVGEGTVDGHNVGVIMRWTSNGVLDSGFAGGGVVTFSYSGLETTAIGVATDSANRILMAVSVNNGTSAGNSVALLRYRSDGTLDTSFGKSGAVEIARDDDQRNGYACCVVVDKSDRPVIAGTIEHEDGEAEMFVARFTKAGEPDTSFGNIGITKLSRNVLYSVCSAITLDSRGRPWLVGTSTGPLMFEATTIQLNLDGSLNAAAGFGGIFTTNFGASDTFGTSILIDDLGRPTVAAYGYDRDGEFPAIMRYDEIFAEGFD